MPLLFCEKTESAACLAVWQIEEEESTLLSQVKLTDPEKALFASMSNLSRRQQWLSVRILFAELQKMLGIYSEIFYDAQGKPFTSTGHHISVSHTPEYASVLISEAGRVGVDIEKAGERILKVRHRFVNEDEARVLDVDDSRVLTYIWTVKEAVYKLFGQQGLDFKDHMKVQAGIPHVRVTASGKVTELAVCTRGIGQQHILTYVQEI